MQFDENLWRRLSSQHQLKIKGKHEPRSQSVMFIQVSRTICLDFSPSRCSHLAQSSDDRFRFNFSSTFIRRLSFHHEVNFIIVFDHSLTRCSPSAGLRVSFSSQVPSRRLIRKYCLRCLALFLLFSLFVGILNGFPCLQ